MNCGFKHKNQRTTNLYNRRKYLTPLPISFNHIRCTFRWYNNKSVSKSWKRNGNHFDEYWIISIFTKQNKRKKLIHKRTQNIERIQKVFRVAGLGLECRMQWFAVFRFFFLLSARWSLLFRLQLLSHSLLVINCIAFFTKSLLHTHSSADTIHNWLCAPR